MGTRSARGIRRPGAPSGPPGLTGTRRPGPHLSSRRRPAVLLACAAALFACGDAGPLDPPGPLDPGGGSRELAELERLAFLPRTQFVLAVPGPGGGRESRAFELPEAVLIDRFEVTRGQWQAFLERRDAVDPVLRAHVDGWAPGTESWPASFMTRSEAQEFARWRGMRLARASEWLFAALGHNRWPYPWGTTFRESVANTLDLGLGRPTPVGTFESGRSPSDCYDLLGNVSEWVADSVPSAERPVGTGGVEGELGSALGGSFRSWTGATGRMIYDVRHLVFPLLLDLHPASRNDHVGLRCTADAADYLWEHAAGWGSDERSRTRLVAVGERFGRQALPLLTELAARAGAPPGLAALAEGARR